MVNKHEMGWIALIKKLTKEKHIVIRERTPVETLLYAAFLYLEGLSLKGVKPRRLWIYQSGTAIYQWIQKFSTLFKEKIADDSPDVIVADETILQVKDMNLWFWYAIDPETRKAAYFEITWDQINLACKQFFEELEIRYDRKPKLLLTDGGRWYLILLRLGISHKAISGRVRSYIERVIETIKDRTRMFDNYFPSKYVWIAGHIKGWIDLYLFYYNWIRSHMSFDDNSPILAEKGIVITLEYERYLYIY